MESSMSFIFLFSSNRASVAEEFSSLNVPTHTTKQQIVEEGQPGEAQKFLCIPASSIASEQLFSTAIDTYTYRRRSLNPRKSTKKKQLEEELTKIKEEFKEYSGLLVASCEKKNVDLVKEISQIKELVDTKNALDNASDVILKLEKN
uniref:HAT C-terminal dimerisation domain-containing protein n=1 Tax=Meloidogyne javanica TaxID=6303 RepID=A0A915M887_MELJA